MAQIDLKNATIKIKDGYPVGGPSTSGQFLVNNAGGYANGSTTMTIDTGNGVIQTGDLFTVVGSSGIHRVTAHVETLGATTSITFTPGLVGGVVDNAIISFQNHELEVKIGEGNLTWTEKKNMIYTKDRGKLSTVREGDQEPVEVKLDFIWEFLKAVSGSAVPTIEDVLKKRGEAALWVSSSADPCEPYAVKVEVVHIPPCGGVQKETVLITDFRYEELAHDLRQAQVSVSGKANVVEPTVTRSA